MSKQKERHREAVLVDHVDDSRSEVIAASGKKYRVLNSRGYYYFSKGYMERVFPPNTIVVLETVDGWFTTTVWRSAK